MGMIVSPGSFQRSAEERQAPVHAMVDAGVAALELLVGVRHPGAFELPRQYAGAVVNVVLVVPAAVQIEALERLQARRVAAHQVDRVVTPPGPPAGLDAFAGF